MKDGSSNPCLVYRLLLKHVAMWNSSNVALGSSLTSVSATTQVSQNPKSGLQSPHCFPKVLHPVGRTLIAALAFPVVSATSVEVPPHPATSNDKVTIDKVSDDEKRSWTSWLPSRAFKKDVDSPWKSDRTLYSSPLGETAKDRIRAMYTLDQYGRLGPEWTLILNVFYTSAIVGGLVGFFVGGRRAAVNFTDRNEATKFLNEMAARRALQDKMTLGMARGALMWGWRVTLFTTMYLFFATHFSVLRGRSSVLDFAAAGAVTGGLWKFLQGPRALLVAGGLGSVLGLAAGGFSLGLLKLTGTSLEEIRYWHYHSHNLRRSREVVDTLPEKTVDPLSLAHDALVAQQLEDEKSTD